MFGASNSPIIDLRLKISLPADCGEIRLDMYDCQHLATEELDQLDASDSADDTVVFKDSPVRSNSEQRESETPLSA